ncbi:hypothetical protein Lser_V15G23870 [Lactuca serriola]
MKLYLIFAVFLLSNLHTYEVEGIRLGKVTLQISSYREIIKMLSIKGSNDQDHELPIKTDALPSGTTLKNRRLSSRVGTQNSHRDHWLPKIHEDYYGPNHHRPRHH